MLEPLRTVDPRVEAAVMVTGPATGATGAVAGAGTATRLTAADLPARGPMDAEPICHPTRS